MHNCYECRLCMWVCIDIKKMNKRWWERRWDHERSNIWIWCILAFHSLLLHLLLLFFFSLCCLSLNLKIAVFRSAYLSSSPSLFLKTLSPWEWEPNSCDRHHPLLLTLLANPTSNKEKSLSEWFSDPPKTLHEWIILIVITSLLPQQQHHHNTLFLSLSLFFHHGLPSLSHLHVPNPWRSRPPPTPPALHLFLPQRLPLFPTPSLSR